VDFREMPEVFFLNMAGKRLTFATQARQNNAGERRV